MKNSIIWMYILFAGILIAPETIAQVGINDDNSAPDPSAMLDVKSTSKGVLVPRLSHAQLDAITTPSDGLILYCIDCGSAGNGALVIFNNNAWYMVETTCLLPVSPTQGTHVATANQIVWNWNAVTNANGYKWSATNDYVTALDMGTATTKTETDLNCNTLYTRYVWSYNSCGNSGSTTITQSTTSCPWACGQPFTDIRDGKTYSTVMIGTQCWMAQNLNAGTMVNGTSPQLNNETIEKYCFDDLETNCNTYGGLYQWGELMGYGASSSSNPSGRLGICPESWHVPSDAEFSQLADFLGGIDVAGGKMKEEGTAHWYSPNIATNSSGFTALPGGYRLILTDPPPVYIYFGNIYEDGYYWTATEYNSPDAWYRVMFHYNDDLYGNYVTKADGFSCRCVKD